MARYFSEERATVRKTAAVFGISKSTVHKDLTVRLREIDGELYKKVCDVLLMNKQQRHIRGGNATRIKYKRLRNT
ncbi:MAG: sporulation transcriptional regulator SpoIIID [Clostridia bacterium]|nr:sporulation transcriptional regulator SpoIIID [Clostridia bacterium]